MPPYIVQKKTSQHHTKTSPERHKSPAGNNDIASTKQLKTKTQARHSPTKKSPGFQHHS